MSSVPTDSFSEPYGPLIDEAERVAEASTSTDKQRRSAVARVHRLRSRATDRGVSVFDFDAVREPALRVYYVGERSDGDGDERLANMLADPFAPRDDASLIELLDRPFVRLKRNATDESFAGESGGGGGSSGTAFHMARDARFSTRREGELASPFERGDAVVLFDDATRRPVYRGRVLGVNRDESYAAASGTMGIAIEPFANDGDDE